MQKKKHAFTLKYLTSNLSIVIGLVLIWRGIWYILDGIDLVFFANDHFATAVVGIAVGILVLYLPDKNLDELKKL